MVSTLWIQQIISVTLLKLLNSTSNADIKYLLHQAPRDASYTSKTICEQIIEVICDSVTHIHIEDAKRANFFTVLVDKARDVSNKEQMALVIRFVDQKYNIRKEFIKFVHCNIGLSGEVLAKLILNEVRKSLVCLWQNAEVNCTMQQG